MSGAITGEADFLQTCPAGRAHYAWGGHFVTGIPCGGEEVYWSSRWSESSIVPTNGRAHEIVLPRPIDASRSDRPTRSGPVRQDMREDAVIFVRLTNLLR